MSAYQLLKSDIYIVTSNAQETYGIYGNSIPKSQLQVRIPQNLKVEFAIPDKLTESDDIIYRNRSIGAHQGIMEEFFTHYGRCHGIFYRFIYGVLSDKCCTGSQSVCVYAKN